MDGRIEHGFRARFRALAGWTGGEDADVQASRLMDEAMAMAASEGTSRAHALATVWLRELGAAKRAWNERSRGPSSAPPWARFD